MQNKNFEYLWISLIGFECISSLQLLNYLEIKNNYKTIYKQNITFLLLLDDNKIK